MTTKQKIGVRLKAPLIESQARFSSGHYLLKTGTNEFVTVSAGGVSRYNVNVNKWTKLIQFEKDHEADAFVYDDSSNKIYGGGDKPWMIIDLNTKKVKYYDYDEDKLEYMEDPCLLNIEGVIHYIGSAENSDHVFWDDNLEIFRKLNTLSWYQGPRGAVYIPKEKKVLFIGYEAGDRSIWRYDPVSFKNEDLGLKIPTELWEDGATITTDQNYVIFVAGPNSQQSIYVLNIKERDNYEFRKSKIKLPFHAFRTIVTTGDDESSTLIVSGWIRSLYKSWNSNAAIAKIAPPLDIIKLIAVKFYSQVMVHFVYYSHKKKANKHFAITLANILVSSNKII